MSYKELKSYQGATIIYDFTVEFCRLYLTNKPNWTNKSYKTNLSPRTIDQMIQAARSGKQNIVEGSSERSSKKSELYLLGVARASLQELLEDYEDYVRQRSFAVWEKNATPAQAVRALVYKTNWSYLIYKSYLNNPETAANVMLCLINQVNFLLDRQITSLKDKFIREGGFTEELHRKRIEYRNRNKTY